MDFIPWPFSSSSAKVFVYIQGGEDDWLLVLAAESAARAESKVAEGV